MLSMRAYLGQITFEIDLFIEGEPIGVVSVVSLA